MTTNLPAKLRARLLVVCDARGRSMLDHGRLADLVDYLRPFYPVHAEQICDWIEAEDARKAAPPSARNPNGLGFYARTCRRCGGRGCISAEGGER